MKQTLYTIPHEWLGVPVFGFGWVLMAWAVVSVIALIWLVRRQGWNAETGSYVSFFLIVAAVIAFGLPIVEAAQHGPLTLNVIWQAARGNLETEGLPIRGYGAMLLLAVATGVGLAAWRARRMGIDPDLIYALAFTMFVFGILGARLFYVIEYWKDFQRPTLSETILAIANVTQGGLVVYGSAIGAVAAGAVFLWRRGLPVLATADLIAPSMMIGLALGRIGCFLNGCCFGGVCELPWAVRFPENSPPYARQLETGLIHGFYIGEDESGRAVVDYVDPQGAAARAGLREGDAIQSIQLPPGAALQAAGAMPVFAGKEIAVQLASGEKRRLQVPAWKGGTPEENVERLGIEVASRSSGPAPVVKIAVGGPAAKAGLSIGDQIAAVRLPPTPTPAMAQSVMQAAGPEVSIETARGAISWTQHELPPRTLPIHPTQIYSAINGFLIFFFLWVYYPFRTRDGEVFAWMLTIYPITRFLEEHIRTDEPPQWGTGLSISQLISIAVLAAAVALWFYLSQKPSGTVWPVRTQPQERQLQPAVGRGAR